MSRLSREIVIDAGRAAVWAAVADIGNVAAWNPYVRTARSEFGRVGVGTVRHCELEPSGSIEEQVSVWVEHEELWFAIGRHGGIRSAEMGFILTDAQPDAPSKPATSIEANSVDAPTSGEATSVEAIADYHLAVGPIGPVIDYLTVRRAIGEMLDSSLGGLKSFVEQQESLGRTR